MGEIEDKQRLSESGSPQNVSIIHEDQYEILAARRQSFNEMIWQTPVLSLTAQAFLFTIALAPGVKRGAQILSGILALVAALASIQLMIRHRQFEVESSEWLAEYERSKKGFKPIHQKPAKGGCFVTNLFMRSYYIWLLTLVAFALGACAVVFKPSWFE